MAWMLTQNLGSTGLYVLLYTWSAVGEDLLENGAEGCEQSKLQAPTQELSADSHGGTAPGSHSHSTPGDAGNAGDEDEDEDLDAVTL